MADPAGKDERPAVSQRARLANLSSLAFVFPVSIGVSFVIGNYLDGKLGTSPWLTIVFFFLGIAAGFINLLRAVQAFDRKD